VLALLAAWIIGKVGVARWIGASLMPETDADLCAARERAPP